MNEVFSITLGLILLTISLVPFFIVIAILFPSRMAKTQANTSRMPSRCLAVGAINFLFLVALGLILFSLAEKVDGVLKFILFFPALLVALIFSMALSFGLGSMASLVGERFTSVQSVWQRMMWGTRCCWAQQAPYRCLVGSCSCLI